MDIKEYGFKVISGKLYSTRPVIRAKLPAQVSTSGASFRSTGFGVNVTPVFSGNMLVHVFAEIFSDTADQQCGLQVYSTTAAIPSNGTVISDQPYGDVPQWGTTHALVSQAQAIALTTYNTGNTIGTAFNIYLGYVNLTNSANNVVLTTPTIMEIEEI